MVKVNKMQLAAISRELCIDQGRLRVFLCGCKNIQDIIASDLGSRDPLLEKRFKTELVNKLVGLKNGKTI